MSQTAARQQNITLLILVAALGYFVDIYDLLLFLIIKNLTDINTAALPEINKLINNVKSKGIEPVVLTSGNSEEIVRFLSEHQLNVPYYYVDTVVLKTISRSNPGLWLLKDGVVKGKWHYNDTPTPEEVIDLVK